MGHKHHGKSSANFLDADEILSEFDFNGNETFLDAGCGDGYISIKAAEKYLPDGKVYAIDSYDKSINDLNEYKLQNNIENLTNIEADLTKTISGVDDSSVDVVFMLNVFHGFDHDNQADVIEELLRVINDGGKIAIMDFKPFEMQKGPPIEIKKSPEQLEEIFNDYGLKKTYLNEEIGESLPEGKSHYLIMFEKE